MDVSGEIHAMVVLTPPEMSTSTHWMGGSMGPSAGLDALEKKKITCPCWDSNLWSSTPWATPQTDCTLPVPLNVLGNLHNGRLCKTGVECTANAAGVLSESQPPFCLLFKTLCDRLYTDTGLQTIYSAWPRVSKMLGRTQKKKTAFHAVWRANQIVQTRFLQTGRFRLPAWWDEIVMHSWSENKKDEADVLCV